MRNQSTLSLVVTRALVAGCLVAPLLVAAPRTAQAQNLVANPGFESGLAGWTATGNVVGDTYAAQIGQGLSGDTSPYGTSLALFNGGQLAPTGVLSQTLITAPLTTYTFSFNFGSFASQPNRTQSIIARAVDSVTGVVLGSLTVTDTNANTQQNIAAIYDTPRSLSFTTITGTGTRIEFLDQAGSTTDRSDGYLDSVSVTAAAVPEPGAGLLLLATLPLAGVVVARRRKMGRAVI